MLREIRMAGFKYMGDMIPITNEHNPIRIYKETTGSFGCDVIEIVYGDVDYNKPGLGTEATYTHTRYKITYECETSSKLDLEQNKSVGYQLVKSREKWDGSKWKSNESGLFSKVPVLDYVQDLVFIPYDEKGKILSSKSSGGSHKNGDYSPSNERTYDLRTVDIAFIVRSTKKFYKNKTVRKILSIATTGSANQSRDLNQNDQYFRETIAVTANARNVGLN